MPCQAVLISHKFLHSYKFLLSSILYSNLWPMTISCVRVSWSCDAFRLFKPMPCCFIRVCKLHFFRRPSTAQWLMMCCAVCGFPQTQSGESIRSQWNMVKLNRPIPVWRRFGVTHSFLGRLVPGGWLASGANENCLGRFTWFQESSLSKSLGGQSQFWCMEGEEGVGRSGVVALSVGH